MPKKGSSGEHNWSFAFSPRKSHPRPKLFQEDRRTLQNILVDSLKDYKYRKNEMFKRMKVTTFVQMVLQVAEFEYREELPILNETDTPFRPDTADLEVQKIQSDGRSGGEGQGSLTLTPGEPDTREGLLQRGGKQDGSILSSTRALVSSNACPYLLLDIRDRDTFLQSHIITAKSYPSPTLARAVNYESKDMLRYRNQEGKIIILYDNEEAEQTIRAATTLVERGYNNVFLLTGGLREAYRIFPKGLIAGIVPASFSHGEGQGHGVKVGRVTRAASELQTAREESGKSDFTHDDLDCLHIYLDNALKDNSSGSRLTQNPRGPAGRTCTRLSSLSSSTTTTGTGRRPFRP